MNSQINFLHSINSVQAPCFVCIRVYKIYRSILYIKYAHVHTFTDLNSPNQYNLRCVNIRSFPQKYIKTSRELNCLVRICMPIFGIHTFSLSLSLSFCLNYFSVPGYYKIYHRPHTNAQHYCRSFLFLHEDYISLPSAFSSKI